MRIPTASRGTVKHAFAEGVSDIRVAAVFVQVAGLAVLERGEAPVVDDDDFALREALEELLECAVGVVSPPAGSLSLLATAAAAGPTVDNTPDVTAADVLVAQLETETDDEDSQVA